MNPQSVRPFSFFATGANGKNRKVAHKKRKKDQEKRKGAAMKQTAITPNRIAMKNPESFYEIGGSAIKELIDRGILDPECRYQNAPAAKDILNLIDRYPFLKGRITESPRIALTGIGWKQNRDGGGVSMELLRHLAELFRYADECIITLEYIHIRYTGES